MKRLEKACCLIQIIQYNAAMANYDHKNPAFLELALWYEHLIDAGAYKEGDRLPSVREVAVSERLNPNTVARAFQKIAADGYCTAIEKRGYFVSKKTPKNLLVDLFVSLLKEGKTEQEIQEALKAALKEVNS